MLPSNARIRFIFITAGTALLLVLQGRWALEAQLPAARLLTIFPPGGQQGSTFEVSLGGADLDEVTRLVFSHAGISAVPKTRSPGAFEKGPQAVPNRFVVTISPEVPEGMHEVRAVGKYGISNPRLLVVGTLDEIVEKEGNNSRDQANPVPLETTVNGSIGGGADVDYFRFSARKGQRIQIDCWAERIDSQLDATLVLEDESGLEIQRSRDRERRDPALDFTVPADGEYRVRIFDLVYGGSSQHFYRLSVGTFPRIDYIFPPAGLPGTRGRHVLYGRNLPGGQPAGGIAVDGQPLEMLSVEIQLPWEPVARDLTPGLPVQAPETAVDGIEYRLRTPRGSSNPVLLGFAAAPVRVESEPNNTSGEAQRVTAPCEVAGQFYPRDDRDWIAFEARKGEVYWIEVLSQRLGVPADPFLVVQQVTTDKEGKESVRDLTSTDDLGGNIGGNNFNTQTDDPAYRLVAPVDGLYRVLVHDLGSSQSDPRHIYRLSIRPERPDFRLVAVPRSPIPKNNYYEIWAPLLRGGGTELIDVLAFRRDGFDGEIALAVDGLPPGVSCPGAIIGPGRSSATLVLRAADDAAEWAGTVRVVGTATLGGGEVVRPARAGTVVWPGQQNRSVPHCRLSHDLTLAVSATETAPYLVELGEGKPLEMARGGKLVIPVKVNRRGFKGDIKLVAFQLPSDVKANNFTLKGDAAEGKLELTLNNNAPVGTFTIHLDAQAQVDYSRNPEAAKRAADWKREIDTIVADRKAASEKAKGALAAAEKELAAAKEARGKAAESVTTAETKSKELEEAARQAVIARDAARKTAAEAAAALEAAEKKAAERKAAGAKRIEVRLESAEKAARALAAAGKALDEKKVTAVRAAAARKAAEKRAAEATVASTVAAEAAAGAAAAAAAAESSAAAAARKAAAAREAAKKNPDDPDLAAALEAAERAAAAAARRAQEAVAAREVAEKNAARAAEVAKKAAADLEAQERSERDALAAVKPAEEARKRVEGDSSAATRALEEARREESAAEKDAAAKIAELRERSKKETAAATAAGERAAEAAEQARVAAAALVAAREAGGAAVDAEKRAAAARESAAKAAADLESKLKAATEEQSAADKRAKDAANAAKPKKINTGSPSTSATFRITSDPIRLVVGAGRASVKPGEKLEIPVTVERLYDFADTVNIKASLDGEVKGIQVAPLDLAKDRNEGKLVLEAAADATPGRHAITLTATAKFAGQNREVRRTVLVRVGP